MTLKIFALITIFSAAAAQAQEADAESVIVIEDAILRESLRKQGIPTSPSQAADQSANRQNVTELRQEQQEPPQKSQVQKLERQVNKLQKQVEELKRPRQEQKESKQKREPEPKISSIELSRELKNSSPKADIGKFSVSEGMANAKAIKTKTSTEKTANEKQIPALQICATMADVNRMSQEDFKFLGFDQEVARRIIQARERLGEFKSSKQITTVEGVLPETFQAVEDDIIAIRGQRLAE